MSLLNSCDIFDRLCANMSLLNSCDILDRRCANMAFWILVTYSIDNVQICSFEFVWHNRQTMCKTHRLCSWRDRRRSPVTKCSDHGCGIAIFEHRFKNLFGDKADQQIDWKKAAVGLFSIPVLSIGPVMLLRLGFHLINKEETLSVCLTQRQEWFRARPAQPVELKLGVTIPWDT